APAARATPLLALLDEHAQVSDEPRALKREMQRSAGIETDVEETPPTPDGPSAAVPAVVPQSVVSRSLATPFLAPDFSAARPTAPRPTRLASWELIGPLLSSFERAGAGEPACMALPAPTRRQMSRG